MLLDRSNHLYGFAVQKNFRFKEVFYRDLWAYVSELLLERTLKQCDIGFVKDHHVDHRHQFKIEFSAEISTSSTSLRRQLSPYTEPYLFRPSLRRQRR